MTTGEIQAKMVEHRQHNATTGETFYRWDFGIYQIAVTYRPQFGDEATWVRAKRLDAAASIFQKMEDASDDLDELPAPPRKDIPAADRELLELAARALGAQFEEVDGEGYGNLHFEDGSVVYGWNPLHFSGDAFELGVRLGLFDDHATFQHHLATELSRGGDPLEANKRAVVLTAAATGKANNA